MPELTFRLIIENGNAKATLADTGNAAKATKAEVEKPVTLKVKADNALGTIRDLKIAFDGLTQIVSGVTGKINQYLDKIAYQERAERKIIQAVRQTGEAAGFSAQQLFDMAAQLQEITNFGDEETLNKVIAQLLTFTNIQGDQFKGAVVAAQNLATVLDGDLQGAAIQLGKALNDPTKGLTALTRSGVSFSEAEQEMILAMWEAGKQAEAQQLILEGINAQYGGQAEAVIDLRIQVRNLWSDTQESIGGMIKTLMEPLLKSIKSLYEWYGHLLPYQKSLTVGLVALVPIITTVASTVAILRSVILALNAAMAANPITLIITGISLLITVVLTAVSALGGWSNAFALFKESSVAVLTIVWDYIAGFGLFLKDFALGMGQVLTAPWQIMYRVAVEVFSKLASVMRKLVTGDFAGVWSEIRDGMSKGFNDTIASTVGSFKSAFDSFDGLGEKAKATWEAVGITARKSMEDAKKSTTAPTKPGNQPGAGGGGEDTEDKSVAAIAEYYRTLRFAADGYYDYMIAQYQADRDEFVKVTGDKEKAEALYNSKVEQLSHEREEYARKELAARQSTVEEGEKLIEEEDRKRQELAESEKRRQQEIHDTRYEFEQRGLELAGNTYDSEMNAIDEFYARRHDKLIEAGYSEEDITRQTEQAKQAIRESYNRRALDSLSSSLGKLGTAVKDYGKSGFAAWKAMAISQAFVDTYSSANAAYKAVAGIPVVGPALAVAAAAAAIASGLANVNAIGKTPYKAAKGGLTGLLIGKSHAQGGTLIEAEGDEYIFAKNRVRMIGQRFLDFLNFGPMSQVQLALAGMPGMVVPSVPSHYYASGGIVSAASDDTAKLLQGILSSIQALNRNVVQLDNRPQITVETSDPEVRVRRDVIRQTKLTARGEQYDPSL